MNLKLVISGGQTGADQAALRAARAAGVATGGWAPKGWETEDGPAPWLADFGLRECPDPGYPARTEANARDSDATLWFGPTRDARPWTPPAADWRTPAASGGAAGYWTTRNAADAFKRPFMVVERGRTKPTQVRRWLDSLRVETLNVAGSRESKSPGIGARVEAFLGEVFRPIGKDGGESA